MKRVSKESVFLDKRNYFDKQCEVLNNTNPNKHYFKVLKSIFRRKKIVNFGIKDKNGKIVTANKDILEVWATFYSNLYKANENEPEIEILDTEHPEIPWFTEDEVNLARKKLKDQKAAGPDSIPSELIKCGGKKVVEVLTRIFNQILVLKTTPRAFKESEIVVLYKKKNPQDPNNYRPIS